MSPARGLVECDSLSFDDRLSLAVDELYCRKNNNRVKRLISTVKLRYPAADMNTLSKSG